MNTYFELKTMGANRVFMTRIGNAKTPGISILDPHIRLAYAIVKNAVDEFRDVDPLKSFDALCWLLDDAEDWLEMLSLYTLGDGLYFDLVVQSEGSRNG